MCFFALLRSSSFLVRYCFVPCRRSCFSRITFTSSTEWTIAATPPALRILLIVASCSFVAFPDGVFTSKAINRPFTQAIMSGIPAVPYIPPCSFQQKHPGTVYKYRRILVTILFSDITAYPPKKCYLFSSCNLVISQKGIS